MRIAFRCCCFALILLVASSAFAQWQSGYKKDLAIDFQSVYFPTSAVGYVVGSSATIYKSINSGDTWAPQTSAVPATTVFNRVFFTNATTGWAVGSNAAGSPSVTYARMIQTVDGGANWVENPISGVLTGTSLRAVYFRGSLGWIGGTVGKVYYTIDGGVNWLPGTMPVGYTDDVNDIVFVSDTVGYAVVDGDGVMYTTNGGVTWTASTVSFGTYPYTRDDLEAVIAIDDTLGVATGWGSLVGPQPTIIVVTKDAGKTWSSPDPAIYHWQTFGYGYGLGMFTDKELILVGGGSGSAAFVHHSVNNGTTWASSPAFNGGDLNDCCALPGTSKVVACGNEGALALSKDKGRTWTYNYKPGPGFAGWLGSTHVTSDKIYMVGANGALLRLNQDAKGVPTGGWKYTAVSPRNWAPTSLEDIWYIGGVMYVSGSNRYLCKSLDKGETWTQLSHAPSALDAMYKMWWFDANNGFIVGKMASQETIWQTSDGGTTLNVVWYDSLAGNLQWNSISFAPNNPSIGVICGDDNRIVYTADGGATWHWATENIATATLDCEEVHMTSATDGWMVGDNGTFLKTTNGGQNWVVQTPLSALSLMDVEFRYPDQPTYGWMVGDDQSFYYTANSGANWTAANPTLSLASYDINTVHFQTPAGVIWIGADYGEAQYRLPDAVTAIESPISLPYVLGQNYPNPFNPTTTFEFTLPDRDFVALNVYDVNGRLVAKVLNKEMGAGEHVVRFDASGLASGVYFYKLETSTGEQAKKMVLLR